MAKRLLHEPIPFDRKRLKRRDVVEYYGHPSPLARELWLYLIAIGKSRCEPGFAFQRAGDRLGHVLHYVHRGEMWHRLNDKEFRAGKGKACLLDLSRKFSQGNDQARAVDLWWVAFDGRDVPRIRAELGVERNPVFDHLDKQRVETLFRELLKLTVQQPRAYEAKSHALLNAIVAELFASRARQADWSQVIGGKAVLSDKVQTAVEFIERMYYKDIGLKHIESAVGLNLCHLSRRFRHELGMPPIQYLNRFRVEQAKRLLTVTNKPVAEVARLVGVRDQDYFFRLFRKLVGDSPGSYRKQQNHR